LIELHTPLAHAQKEVETALDELHAAQARLRRLELLLSTLSVSLNAASGAMNTDAGRPPSSLVARILQEAAQRTGHLHQSKSTLPAQPLPAQETALWNEMEIDRFTEANVLAHSFTEAIADVATATSQLRLAFEHLNSIVTQQVDQANIVRSNAHLLRSAPFSILVTQLQQSVELMAGDQIGRVQLELSGETIEIDQDIDRVTDDLVRLLPLDVHQESHSAGIMFVLRIIETLLWRRFGNFHAAVPFKRLLCFVISWERRYIAPVLFSI